MENFVWQPGAIIEVQDSTLGEKTRLFINEFWDELVDADVIWEKMISGELGGLFSFLGDEYAKRAVRLRPLVLPRRLSEELRVYYQQAIGCWVHGLNAAAIILVWSVIEGVLYQSLHRDDPELRRKRIWRWIAAAKSKRLLDEDSAGEVWEIYRLRNKAVHEQSDITEGEVLDAIFTLQRAIWKVSGACSS